jgi:hypothetical protein
MAVQLELEDDVGRRLIKDTLKFEINVGDREYVSDLLEELTSKNLDNPGELMLKLDECSPKSAFWSMLTIDAETEVENAKIQRDLWFANRMGEARDTLAIDRPKSYVVSDTAAKQLIYRTYQDDVWEIEGSLIEKEANWKKVKVVKEAWERRTMILQSLLKATMQTYES